jgi:hydroxymethylglutaryl-CoA lyase
VSKGGPRPSGKKLYSMDMPFVETLDHARHFITGAEAYQGAPSPWKEVIKSPQRPEPLNGDAPKAEGEQNGGRWLPS